LISNLEKSIQEIDRKIEYNLISAKVYDHLIVVWCGNLLKYAKIEDQRLGKFKDLEVEFEGSVEI